MTPKPHTPKPDTERPREVWGCDYCQTMFTELDEDHYDAYNATRCGNPLKGFIEKSAYDALEAENTQLLKEQKQIVFSRRDAIANLKSAKEQIASLTKELDMERNRVEVISKERDEANRNWSAARDGNKWLSDDHTRLEKENTSLKDEIKALREKISIYAGTYQEGAILMKANEIRDEREKK